MLTLFLIVLVFLFLGLSLLVEIKSRKKNAWRIWFIIVLSILLILTLLGLYFKSSSRAIYTILFWIGGYWTLVLIGVIMNFPGYRKHDFLHPDEEAREIFISSSLGSITGGLIFSAILYFSLHFPLYVSVIEMGLPFFFSSVFLPAIFEKYKDEHYLLKSFFTGFAISLSIFFMIIGAKGLT